MALLLENTIPRQQLNSAIFSTLRPMMASFGPWRSGLGMQQRSLQVEIQVSLSGGNIQFSQVAPHQEPVSVPAMTMPILPALSQSPSNVDDQLNARAPPASPPLLLTWEPPESFEVSSLSVGDQ